MSKKTTVQAGAENQDQALSMAIDAFFKSGKFTELSLDRTLYKPELCGDTPVVGHIVEMRDMPPINPGTKNQRDWKGLILVCTQPTKGVGRDGDVVDVRPGEEILLPVTHQLLNLRRFAEDIEVMHEVVIQPKTKIDLGNGQEMWTYRIGLSNEAPIKRTGPYVLNKKETTAALPTGEVFDKQTGEVKQAVVAQA